jgi:Bax protein
VYKIKSSALPIVLLFFVLLPFFPLHLHANTKISRARLKFIQTMLPMVNKQNQFIYQQRQSLLQLQTTWNDQGQLPSNDMKWLFGLAKSYKVAKFNPRYPKDWTTLLNRVNTLPVSMVLAQAIVESYWGQSRFAKQGNNLFGVWCYYRGCGLIPKRRPAGKTFEVRRYPSWKASITDYFRIINTNHYYKSLRNERTQLQSSGDFTGLNLCKHLHAYSQKGQGYVSIIEKAIINYGLAKYDQENDN